MPETQQRGRGERAVADPRALVRTRAGLQPGAVAIDDAKWVYRGILKADERTRPIPVIVLTSSDQDRDLVECYRLGVNSYIKKPSELLKFQEMVRLFTRYWLNVNRLPPPAAFAIRALGETV